MNDTTRIDQLLHQEGGGSEVQQPSLNDDALVNDILSKIKQQENTGGGEPVMTGQSNVNLTVQANPPINGQQQHQQQQHQQQGTINDPNPNTTINQQVDPEIARTIQRQQKEVRFMDEDEDDDDEDESVGQFELQNDVHFSLTDLIIRELRKPIIFAFLIILALLPISNQLIQKYLPFIGGSDVLTLSFKTFICTLIFYVLNKLSLF
jgi:hypothetical protein